MVRRFLIKLLGGITRIEHLEEMDSFMDACEDFAKKNLCAKLGATLQGDGVIDGAYYELDVIVTGSRTRVYNMKARGFKAAPWVRNCLFSGLQSDSSNINDCSDTSASFIYIGSDNADSLKSFSANARQDKRAQTTKEQNQC